MDENTGLSRILDRVLSKAHTFISSKDEINGLDITSLLEEPVVRDKGAQLHPIEKFKHVELTSIVGLDSSSRFIETPYFFAGIGSVSAINRVSRRIYDCPDILDIIRGGRGGGCKWLLLISSVDLTGISSGYLALTNPAGYRYDPGYNRLIALDELRLGLEIHALEKTSEEGLGDIIVVDGPIYHIPSIFNVYMKGRASSGLEKYFKSWSVLLDRRIHVINELRANGLKVIGIVKRLEYSSLLSRVDPMDISGDARINDHMYLSLMASKVRVENGSYPFILGPFELSYQGFEANLPRRIAYYVGLPRRPWLVRPSNYVFFRVEFLSEEAELLDIVLTDSYGSGALLPLSVIMADSRSKRISNGLRNYFLRLLESRGIPLTYDTMRSIEGLYSG